jgi:AraC-like DNA-binding protein
MATRAQSRREAGPARGVVRGGAPAGPTEHRRVLPVEALAPFVAHFWWVRWSLPEPTLVETLPHPAVHLVIEAGAPVRAEIAGVHTGRFTRQLAGDGWVFGIKFRPAVFQQLLRAPVATLTDRVLPAAAVLGPEAVALAKAIAAAPDLDARIGLAEPFLAARLAPLPREVARVRDLVERIAEDRSLLSVAAAAAALGVDARTLQRRFRQHVGVGPKWVIQRYRLHEAAERLAGPRPPSLAALAAELGYADQAHFTRDFALVVGRPPSRYAARAGGAR